MSKYEVRLSGETVLRVPQIVAANSTTFEPMRNGFQVTRTVEAENIEQAEATVGKWAQAFSDAISIVRGYSVRFQIEESVEIPEPGSTVVCQARGHRQFVADLALPIGEKDIVEAIRLVPKLEAHGSDDDLIRRAIRWFARGAADRDPIDQFLDHWIGLETLSGIYEGKVEPSPCACCGRQNRRPTAKVVQAYVSSLGVQTQRNLLRTLYAVRNHLFHRATAMTEAHAVQPLLTDVLRKCLLKSLEATSTN